MKRLKSYWIKERHNPQFDKPYYSAEGQLSKRAAKKKEHPLYGHVVMLEFANFFEYYRKIKALLKEGYRVYNIPRVCPECDSEILTDQSCMMGHWCGEPRVPVTNEAHA